MNDIEKADSSHLPEIAECLGQSNDAPYDLTRVAEEKCFGAGFRGDPEVHVVRREGAIAGISVTCGRHLRILAVSPRFRGQGIGSALLEESQHRIRAAGERYLEVASEAGNYFTPGVWEGDEKTIRFFQSRGYAVQDRAVNLSVSLTSNSLVPSDCNHPRVVRASEQTAAGVLQFIESHFGPIWKFEVQPALRSSPPSLFCATSSGAIEGFSAHDVNNRGLGFFGPEGVSRALRGQGMGKALLFCSLADLRLRGYDRAVIPWASSIDFYEKSCGARVEHRFVILRKAL